MAEIIVVNVVASASIGKELMLQDIAFQLEEFRKRKTGMKREQVIVLFLIQKN